MQKSALRLFEELCTDIESRSRSELPRLSTRQASPRFLVQMGIQALIPISLPSNG